jgi:hypothetical protein
MDYQENKSTWAIVNADPWPKLSFETQTSQPFFAEALPHPLQMIRITLNSKGTR